MEAKENQRFILYFLSPGDVHPLPGKEWFLGKANILLMNASSPSFSVSYGMEYPFRQFGSATLAMSPLKVLSTPKLLMIVSHVGDTALML